MMMMTLRVETLKVKIIFGRLHFTTLPNPKGLIEDHLKALWLILSLA